MAAGRRGNCEDEEEAGGVLMEDGREWGVEEGEEERERETAPRDSDLWPIPTARQFRLARGILESVEWVRNDERFGYEKARRDPRRGPAVGYWKTWVYHTGGQSISDLYSQALPNKRRSHDISNDTQEMGQTGKRLGSFQHWVGHQLFNEAGKGSGVDWAPWAH